MPESASTVSAWKMWPPAAGGPLLSRPRLEEQLDELFGRRLAVVIGGAGYGKSTLVASWAADIHCVWYSISPEDADVDVLVRGLAAAARGRVGSLPQVAKGRAPGAQREEHVYANTLAAWFCGALEPLLAYDLVLVLDDLHELDSSTSIHFVEALVRQAPSTLRIVLTSRRELPFRIDRLRGQGRVVEITAPMLAFDRDELQRLVDAELGARDPALAERLLALTDGWPAAVRLSLEVVRPADGAERASALDHLAQPGEPIFAYLANEVFDREPIEVQELIRTVAPLERFSIALCDGLGLSRVAPAVASLARRGLFVRAVADGSDWFSLHSLLRGFALTRIEPKELRELLLRAAAWFESRGHLPEALAAYADADAHAELARLLALHGVGLNDRGHGAAVARALDSLPGAMVSDRVQEVLAMIELGRGNVDEALAAMQRAVGDATLLRASQARLLGYIQRTRGRHDLALEALGRARLDGSEPRDEALVVGYAARSHYVLGQRDECRRLALEALSRAKAVGDDHALANAHAALALAADLDGDTASSEEHLDRAVELASKAGHVYIGAGIQNNRADSQIRSGRYQEALTTADHALDLADLSGEEAARSAARTLRGEALTALGRLGEALSDLEQAQPAHASIALGELHRIRGDRERAEKAYRRAVDVAERGAHAGELTRALAGLARTVATVDCGEARRLVAAALALGPGPEHGDALLAAGWIDLADGDRPGACGRVLEIRAEARARERWPLLAETLELEGAAAAEPQDRAEALERARTRWAQLGSPIGVARVELALARSMPDRDHVLTARTERRLRRLGVETNLVAPLGLLSFLPDRRPSAVQVRTLGRFEVVAATGSVTWKSKQARDVLKILIARRGVPVPRDELSELLWPGDDPGKTANRLSVALSVLRSALDPDRRVEAGDFVSIDRGAVHIRSNLLWIDVEAFLREATRGLALARGGRTDEGMDVLRDAENLYGGDFLAEDAYSDWAVPLREEARLLYISTARTLGEHAAGTGDYTAASLYHLRILARDPYDERAHLDRCRTLAADGRPGEARRAYGLYAARMAELDVEPAPFPAGRGPELRQR
jgi:ATP/maltotriose-dependent transcriptional regulator MalT/DNA-binding SARP family transcriptional activator